MTPQALAIINAYSLFKLPNSRVVVGVAAHDHRGQPDNREVPMFADEVPGRETIGTVAPRVKGRPLLDVV